MKRPGDGDGTRTARGEISDFVTNSSFHADGIKVRLRSGEIGRVTRGASGAADGRSSSGSEASTTATETTSEDSSELDDSTTPAVEEGAAIRTAYVSRVSKTAGDRHGRTWRRQHRVRNVRVPVRGGGHMGYMFVECEDGEGMRGVIEALNGMEFKGNALVAERAKEDPKPKKEKRGRTQTRRRRQRTNQTRRRRRKESLAPKSKPRRRSES